ncbi:uncharacterized protein LOC106162239 [Lingula anatina]|uniref:Uncharacterized protein LOC106162239 n=1 Tax=Lingula anatina TaxID=7574 RepID=A0A1S3IBV6_LINAN|nr:uncharacterized protein LOC106162239 [Lingula anatina]|eukprot:XP_013394909.1 uncharacterized protein LOC106162239 [Lingula anatina]
MIHLLVLSHSKYQNKTMKTSLMVICALWTLVFISMKDRVAGEECYSCATYMFETDNKLGSTAIRNALAQLPTDEDCEAGRIANLGKTSCSRGCEKANVTMHFYVQYLDDHKVPIRTVSRGCASAGSSVLISDNGCRPPAGEDDLSVGAEAVFKILESFGAPQMFRPTGEICKCRGNLCNSSTSLFACGILLASCLFLIAAVKSVL